VKPPTTGAPPPTGAPPQSGQQSAPAPYGAQQQPQGGYGQQQGGYGQQQQQGGYGQPQGGATSSYGQANQQNLGWGAQYYNSINQQQMGNLQGMFQNADRDRSGKISTMELSQMPFFDRTIGLPNAKTLMKVFDKDNSGQIDFFEFATLHSFLSSMMNAFQQADTDRSGSLDAREIWSAVSGAGFQVGLGTIQEICAGFPMNGPPGEKKSSGINVEQFISICSRLAAIRSIFEWNDRGRTGRVTFSYEQLAQIIFNQTNSN